MSIAEMLLDVDQRKMQLAWDLEKSRLEVALLTHMMKTALDYKIAMANCDQQRHMAAFNQAAMMRNAQGQQGAVGLACGVTFPMPPPL